jgi:hypothetical protein
MPYVFDELIGFQQISILQDPIVLIQAGMPLAYRIEKRPEQGQHVGIPRRYNHFVFGIFQTRLTCAIAAARQISPH